MLRAEKTITSWSSLVACLKEFPRMGLACRGQASKYDGTVRAKIDRCLEHRHLTLPYRMRMERAICQRFREHAPTYLSEVESRYAFASRWLQLVVMQHYGAPTRLLDWTKSPWVAAFFAVFGEWNQEGQISIFSRSHLEQRLKRGNLKRELAGFVWGPHESDKSFSDRAWDHAAKNDRLFDERKVASLSPWVATYYSREVHFPRLTAQQGLFTFSSKPNLDHWGEIKKLIKNHCFVIKIPGAAKLDILQGLENMGLTAATLFPGADGIGKSMEGFARTWVPAERRRRM